jgi:hypothetical protein
MVSAPGPRAGAAALMLVALVAVLAFGYLMRSLTG